MKSNTLRIILAAVSLVVTSALNAVTHNVSNATEFNALPTLNAGDVVVMASGTYGALDKNLVSSITSDAIAQSNPIIIHAAVNGGVDVNQPSQIILDGKGIILAGIDFIAGSGIKDNGTTSATRLILFDTHSAYMTLSNVRFLDCVSGDDYGHWIEVRGFNHTIEYCTFEGKDDPVANATVAFKRNTSEAGIATTRNHVLRRCYFGPRECNLSDNGYESIRIGDSSSQAHDMNVTIEENVFYRAIWRTDGQKPNEPEIISNKTKGNKIINNTFLESFGQITLRHGDACVVDGNYIFGGGYYDSATSIALNAANDHQSGIRVIGEDHIVRNNYLVNLNGSGFRAAITVMAGDDTWDDGDGSGGLNGYEPANNAQVYNNTMIDCKEFSLGEVGGDGNQPTGVQVYNNVWQGSGSDNGIVRESGFSLGGSGGNYVYHPSSDYGWTGLSGTYSSSTSPDVTESFDQYLIPTSTSPLLDNASATLVAAADVRGLSRPVSSEDIGCFEREVAGSGIKPLFRHEVGPEFDGGPAGTYPGGDLFPVITTSSLASGALNVAYSETLAASSGDAPLVWSISSGSLPAGLSLSVSGVITGTPTATGTINFTVKVTDNDGDEDTQALSIFVAGDLFPVITTSSLANGIIAVSYSETMAVSSGNAPLVWSISSGSLPAGLSLSVSGVITGTPTVIGTSNFTVKVTDGDGDEDTQELTLTIDPLSVDPAKFVIGNSDVIASTDDGNVPSNTLDENLGTRWSAEDLGSGQWIRYDLGEIKNVHYLNIAWYQGNSRSSYFHIDVSNDDMNWTKISGDLESSGSTTALELVDVPDTQARYVRIYGFGNSNPGSDWTSITEVEIWGTLVVAVPSAPTGLAATPGDGQVSLSWSTAAGATSYNVKRSETDGSGYSTIASEAGSSYVDNTASNGTTYFYVVSAVNGSGESADSTQASATPIAPPSAPTGLGATPGDDQVSMSWSTAAGATSYNVKRSENDGGPYTTIASEASNSHVDDAAVNDTTYYYVVSAVNGSGESADSTQTSATPIAPPSAPTGLDATAGDDQVSLSWSTAAGATSYNVKRSTTDGSGYSTIASEAGSSYVDNTASNGTTYYYVVSAVNGSGESSDSTQASATPIAPPSAPTGLAATPGDDQVSMSWSTAAGATSYNVKRSENDGGPYTTIASEASNSHVDDTAVNDTTYYYVVSAVNGSGESADSTQTSATPIAPPSAPAGLAATPGDGEVSLSWTAASGATSYNVKRSTTDGSGYVLLSSPMTLNYVDSAVTNGTTYYYVVSAENGSGESADTSQVSAKPFAPIAPEELVGPNVSLSGGDVDLAFQTVVGRVYQLQRTDTLVPANWVDVAGSSVVGTGAEMVLQDTTAALIPQRFYRVVVQP